GPPRGARGGDRRGPTGRVRRRARPSSAPRRTARAPGGGDGGGSALAGEPDTTGPSGDPAQSTALLPGGPPGAGVLRRGGRGAEPLPGGLPGMRPALEGSTAGRRRSSAGIDRCGSVPVSGPRPAGTPAAGGQIGRAHV